MRRTHTRSYALALALSALVPSLLMSQARPAPRPRPPVPGAASDPANAQSGPGDRMRGPGGRDGARGAGRGGHPASMMLRARQQLALTEDQVTRLEAMQAAPAPKSNETDMMRARADLLDATQGDGNINGARAALDKLSRLRNDQMLARIKTQQEVRAVLTPAQKTKVDNMRQQGRNRMGAKRQAGKRQGRDQAGPAFGRGQRGQRGPMGPRPVPPVN